MTDFFPKLLYAFLVGGFLCAGLGEIPDDGATLSLDTHGLHVEILRVDDHRIEQTRVRVLERQHLPEDGE